MKNAAFAFVAIVILVSPPQASAQQRSACEALSALSHPNTSVTLARSIGASDDLELPSSDRPGRGLVVDLPPFCRVAATLRPSADSDIKIEVWLPLTNWNDKFQAVGNGGFAGSIEYAFMAAALRRGYATSSTDGGHAGDSFAKRSSIRLTTTASLLVPRRQISQITIREVCGLLPQL